MSGKIILTIVGIIIALLILKHLLGRKSSNNLNNSNNLNSSNNAQPQLTTQNKVELINFYTQWCGHSQNLMPIWQEVAQHYANNDNINILAVDCDQQRDLAEQMGIKGYPTIILRTNNENVQYSGPRTRDEIITFANSYLN